MVAFVRTRRRSAVALGRGGGPRRRPHRRRRHPAPPPPPLAAHAAAAAGRCPTRTRRCRSAQRVADLLGRMTLEEKIGQMTQAERASDRRRHLARSPPTTSAACCPAAAPCRRPNTPTAWADMVDRYQAAALTTRLRIPLIYGIDTVHGDGNMHGATVFPHNIGLGATRDPALVRRRRSTSPPRRRGRAGRSGPSHPASAWRATTAGAASTSPSARRRRSWSRWRPRSTASRVRPDTSPTTTGCWPPPSTSPATG